MKISFASRLMHAWNAFTSNKDPTRAYMDIGTGYGYRPDRPRFSMGNERSVVTSVFNRIAMDASAIGIRHVRLDKNGRFLETIDSALNRCLSLEANLDQTGRAFMQDAVMSLLDEGCIALVPVDTDDDPQDGLPGSFDIYSLRVAKILEWYPENVRLRIYNERKGEKDDLVLPKRLVCIIENPLYAVINESNSTMKRLVRKLGLLDVTDEQTASGKLDLIIQLPYVIKTEARRAQAENRRRDIEQQLAGSKYGIAYTDGTERITQLNRSLENNLMKQIEYLTSLLFSQLGITQSILDGTADEKTMLNYYNRTIEPIISAIADEMKRKFLTKTARSQGQDILCFRDPFKLVPVDSIAEIADKFTRNEIMTSNEIRQIIGMRPSSDPKADELTNSNIAQPKESRTSGENPAAAEDGSADEEEPEPLAHHGVKGQKWGVRNGPPYPIGRGGAKRVEKSGEDGRIKDAILRKKESALAKQRTAAIKKGVRTLEKRIKEHESKIKNPEKHYPEWGSFNDQIKEGFIEHWKHEINVFQDSIRHRIDELKERGEYDDR